jgi:hypothetical protein
MIFISHKGGQLGNRLFAFSHIIAAAIANDWQVVNLSFDEYAQYFQTTSQDLFSRFPAGRTMIRSNKFRSFIFLINRIVLKLIRKLSLEKSIFHKVLVADLPDFQFHEKRYYDLDSLASDKANNFRPITFLFGRFFRDYSNFEKYQNQIRLYFQPIPAIRLKVNNLMNSLKQDGVTIIGVHIRRGDYSDFLNGKYFFSHEQYYHKMLELNESTKKLCIRFLICSNEEIDLKRFPGLDCRAGIGSLVEDLYSLAACDLLMGPPSTFTKWASFYGKVPLYQWEYPNQQISQDRFELLPPEKLYNFNLS